MSVLDAITSAFSFHDPVDCVIDVDGSPLVDLYPFLRSVTVDASRDEASTATIVLESQRDERGRWSVQDAGTLALWRPIVISAAFGARTEEMFRGYIREINAAYPNEAADAIVTVECQDESIALDREHVRKVWGADEPTTDALIIEELADKYDLTVSPDSGAGLSGLVLNQDATDIRFLRERAEANGYELYVRDGEIYFGPLRLDAEPQPTILVYAGPDTSCLWLTVRSDAHRPNRVAFDLAPETGTEVTRQEIAPDLALLGDQPAADDDDAGLRPFTWLMTKKGSVDEAELTARAQQIANDASLRVVADGELDGTIYGHVLLAGLPVGVDGTGDTLGGVYYVDRVSHVIDTDGYRQQIRLLRNAFGDGGGLGGGLDSLAGIR